MFVGVLFLSVGFLLDRVVRFWTAQVEIGTVRNPYLFDRLYQKELLSITHNHLPVLRALREITHDPRTAEDLDRVIARLEETVRHKRWTVRPEEQVYDESP